MGLKFFGLGLICIAMLCGCEKQPQEYLPDSEPAPEVPALDPGKFIDYLKIQEAEQIKAHPDTVTRNGMTLTFLRNGQPVASLTDTQGATCEANPTSTMWLFRGPVPLYNAPTQKVETHFRVIRLDFEFSEEAIIDPQGHIFITGKSATPSPDNKFLSAGSVDAMVSEPFTVIEWTRAGKTAQVFDVGCETLSWQTPTTLNAICYTGHPEGRTHYDMATLTRQPSGKWALQRTAEIADKVAEKLTQHEITAEAVKAERLYETPSNPMLSRPLPLTAKDSTYAATGFTRLAAN